MAFTLGEASKACGKSKATLSKAIKSGRLSVTGKTSAGYEIDPAELFRVYPKSSETVDREQSETPTKTEVNTAIEGLKAQLELMREQIDDLKGQRDGWQRQAEQSQALLRDMRQPRPWFSFKRSA